MELEKVTKHWESKERRRYEDACGLAHALELIGERWAPLVLRELMFGPRRFSDLRADLPGISANVLTQRLIELEERGLVVRKKLPPPASVQVYKATEWGLEAGPFMRLLGRWAARSPGHDPGLFVSAVSVMMSIQTMFDAERAGAFNASVGFRFGEAGFVATIGEGRIDVRRDDPEDVDVLFIAEPGQIAGLLYGGAPLETVELRGDMEVAKRFITLFPLPPKIG